jgi:Ca-activated chloride channel family protein
MIDDSRLTIDGWAPSVMVPCTCRSSIPNPQSPICNRPFLRSFVASSLLLLSSAVALADQPRALIEQGNVHFDAGRYAEALEAYDQVGDEPDELLAPELLHNRAAANFKLGRLDEARELWVRATGLRDEKFEAAARYNLGNCDYADALRAAQSQDAAAALELLGRAVQQYRDALKLDAELAHARANLELAARLRKQIEEMAERQPQSQPSSQPGQQEQQQPRPSSSQPSSQPGQSGQPQQDDPQDQPGEQQQEEQPQPDTQPSPESQPAQPQAQPETSPGEEQQEEQQLVPIQMSKEEAERLLQVIRDAERQRRAILRAREAAGYDEVERDW